MTLDPTTSTIFCQNCGAGWVGDVDTTMHYFTTSPTHEEPTTAAELIALGVSISRCPKCPIPRIDRAMYEGDSRTGD